MKRLVFLLVVTSALLTQLAFADVTIRVTDLESKTMRVTYTWIADKAGSIKGIYPGGAGYGFASSPIRVVSVTEKNTEQDLDYQVVPAPQGGGQSVRVIYPNPVPKGGNFRLQITVEAKTNDISRDSEGRYQFKYETGHIAFFVLPEGHAIVYSNYPVLVYERKGRTVVQVKESGRKDLIFKTRAFPTDE